MEVLFMNNLFFKKVLRVFKRTSNKLVHIFLLSLIPFLVYFVGFIFPKITNLKYLDAALRNVDTVIMFKWLVQSNFVVYISLVVLAFLFLYINNFVEDEVLYIKSDEDVDFVPYKEDSPLNWLVFDKNIYANSNDKDRFKKLFKRFLEILSDEKEIGAKVISLEASWGAGKTSFFRIFKGWFQSKENNIKIDNFNFYEYNPWLSQSNNITQDFLHYLKSIIYTEEQELIDTQINNYIQSISANVVKESKLNIFSNLLAPSSISFQVSKNTLLEKVKNVLGSTKIVILIDNIDRLNSHEIIKVLELVKDVADFKNLIFVLAMDKNIVNQAIGKEIVGVNSKHYLEKIIDTEYVLKWAENEYNYLKDFIFRLYFDDLENQITLKSEIKDESNIQEDQNNDNYIIIFEILMIEVFRKKYLNLLSLNQGVKYLVEEPYHIQFEKFKGWNSFAIFLDKTRTRLHEISKPKGDENLNSHRVTEATRSFSSFENKFGIRTFSLNKGLKIDPFTQDIITLTTEGIANASRPKFETFLNSKDLHEAIKVFIGSNYDDMFNAINDRFTIRFIKKFFRDLEVEIFNKVIDLANADSKFEEEMNSNLDFVISMSDEEIAKVIRKIVETMW
jgi:hypothetical protein